MNHPDSKLHGERIQHKRRRLILAGALALAFTFPCVAEDRAIDQRVPPEYPELAKRMRITGVVKMSVTVDASGKVTEVKTISGNRVLAVAAEEAVRKWKFEPGDGVATLEVSMTFGN
ncbi:MAG: energy transducer TonB [Terracidiphilus sp.]|jgi:TonB family protein